jgi:hypothetical protein
VYLLQSELAKSRMQEIAERAERPESHQRRALRLESGDRPARPRYALARVRRAR